MVGINADCKRRHNALSILKANAGFVAGLLKYVWWTESACVYQVMVHSEEGHLAWFVKEVGKGNEGIGFLQIQN